MFNIWDLKSHRKVGILIQRSADQLQHGGGVVVLPQNGAQAIQNVLPRLLHTPLAVSPLSTGKKRQNTTLTSGVIFVIIGQESRKAFQIFTYRR